MVIETDRGRQKIELEGPGGHVRVAVGEPGHRSAVWRLWANPKKSDVYIAARVLAGTQKISLHETGDWRHQWVPGTRSEPFVAQTGRRLISRWDRPSELMGGWTRGLSIWVPDEDVLDVPGDEQSREGVIWIPAPLSGQAVGIHVVIARPDQGAVRLMRTAPIRGFTLASGEIVLVLASAADVTEEWREWLREQRSRIQKLIEGVNLDLSGAGAPRVTLFAKDDDGNRVLWDLGVHVEA